LARRTIDDQCLILRQLLGRLGAAASLERVTVTHLDEAIVGHIADGHYCRATVRNRVGTLRSFFRYAELQGWCRQGLAATIKTPRVFTQQALPRGPSWDEVRQAVALTEGDRAPDIRDRAILLLFAVYGLRAGEVIRLCLEDFDWERELLTVRRSKSGRPRSYPLAGPVGAAILRYLKEVRPRTAVREVFLTRGAPLRPVNGSTLFLIVKRRLQVISPSLPHHGPHALRHACATHLLEQGLSLKEIGDHLGHRHPDTTRIYTKVDLSRLRQVSDMDLGGVL
jgi:site-specific recombinase XerD